MRVTTGMINRHGGGLIDSRKSLLSYIQSGKSGGSSRLSALMAKSGSRSSTKAGSLASAAAAGYTKTGYEKLEKSAASLEKRTSALGEKADQGKVSASDVESLLSDYNDTLKNLYQCDGSLNNFYRQTLRQAATDNLSALQEIGVSYGKDGHLSLNRTQFEKADGETVKAALGSGAGFTKRLGIVSERVSDSAAANTRSASGRYNAGGDISSSYFSRYNFLG
ncbi:MAG: hypothetical protein NC123_01905 [Butyrivibrio sp.]|nr:hypothetical protein [Acetatifactor muris]MCM1558293.1 hypothetical protein [Butyrivibrio sp.]